MRPPYPQINEQLPSHPPHPFSKHIIQKDKSNIISGKKKQKRTSRNVTDYLWQLILLTTRGRGVEY